MYKRDCGIFHIFDEKSVTPKLVELCAYKIYSGPFTGCSQDPVYFSQAQSGRQTNTIITKTFGILGGYTHRKISLRIQ